MAGISTFKQLSALHPSRIEHVGINVTILFTYSLCFSALLQITGRYAASKGLLSLPWVALAIMWNGVCPLRPI